MRADKGEQHSPNMKQAPGQQPALSPSGKMEPKSLFSLHKALAQPVKMCMFDFPVSILDDLVRDCSRLLLIHLMRVCCHLVQVLAVFCCFHVCWIRASEDFN